jgi:endonuclease III
MKKEPDIKKVKEIVKILSKEILDSRIALKFSNPFELLIATILSAQCTDVKVNQVTANLFKRYRSPKDYVNLDLTKLGRISVQRVSIKIRRRRFKSVVKSWWLDLEERFLKHWKSW